MAYELQTLDRALRLVSMLATSGPMRLTDVADGLETNQTTALRTLRVLERHGFVRRTGGGTDYQLGTRLAELGAAALAGIDLTVALRPLVTRLARMFDVTVHVGMLRDGMITVVDKVEPSDSPVRYSALGTRMPLHATAAGKAALALLLPQEPSALGLADPLPTCTPHSFRSLDQLRPDLELTARRGFSIEREEYNVGFACVGSAFGLGEDTFTVSLSGLIVSDASLDDRGQVLRSSMAEFFSDYRGAIHGLVAGPAMTPTP